MKSHQVSSRKSTVIGDRSGRYKEELHPFLQKKKKKKKKKKKRKKGKRGFGVFYK